ncbi:hypothetical protein ACFE04_007149 [Oxalis oulophora]
MAPTVEEIRNAQRADGPATILAIGTAHPTNFYYQDDYANFYFRMCKADHMIGLKEKFKRICKKSMITKRYMHLTEELMTQNPNICSFDEPSLDIRQDIMVEEVPKLGAEAARRAIKEWGQPVSKITHVVFCTTAGVDMPGADHALITLLGLSPSVKRVMLYHQGCHAGGTVLRVAKDLAENNRGSRVLVVNSELTVTTFRGPHEDHLDSLVGQALFADGASSLIIGSDPDTSIERPLFQLVTAVETSILHEVFDPIGINDWNSIFWVSHPGGPAILDAIEQKLRLKKEKLSPTKHILNEYGNMSSACVSFIIDEMRKRAHQEGKTTTGDGLEWGVLFGFGPGLTVETVVLHSCPTQ